MIQGMRPLNHFQVGFIISKVSNDYLMQPLLFFSSFLQPLL